MEIAFPFPPMRLRFLCREHLSRLPALPLVRAWQPRLIRLQRRFGSHALIGTIVLAGFIAGPWFAERPTRAATGASAAVIDGDSLRAGDMDVRLIGIDAPELGQTCRDRDDREWPCGRAAREHLRTLVARGEISCTAYGYDRYRRALAICSAGGIADLGAAMVRAGYALDNDPYTKRYAAAQSLARAERRGLWGGIFDHPADWRAQKARRRKAVSDRLVAEQLIDRDRRAAWGRSASAQY